VGVKAGVAYSRNKLVLRSRLRNLNLVSPFSIFDSFQDIDVHIYDFLKFVGDLWASYVRFFEVCGRLMGVSGRGKLFFGSIDGR